MGKTKKLAKGVSMTKLPDSDIPELPKDLGLRPLSERAMLVRFSVGRWYGTGADNELLAEIQRDKEAKGEIGTFTKRLMDKQRMAEINRVTNEARSFFKSKTLPYDDGNLRLLSIEHFFEVKKRMTAYDRAFMLVVEKFLQGYTKAVDAEKHRLGKLWRERDYPSLDELRNRFRFEVHFRPLESADDLHVALPKQELEAIRKEIAEGVQASIQGAVNSLVAKLSAMLEDLSRRMGDENERIPTSLLDDLKGLAADLPGFNVTGDPALREAAVKISAQFGALSREELVKDKGKRKEAKATVDAVLKSLSLLKKKGESK